MTSKPTLNDVLITGELVRRKMRAPNLAQENKAYHSVAGALGDPRKALAALLQTAIDVCNAGTVGISLLEQKGEEAPLFRWIALAGKLESYVGGCTPRGHSPCGFTLDRDEPQLFRRPGRFFEAVNGTEPPIVEALVLPFYFNSKGWGTIWIVSHSDRGSFDLEDVRVMAGLAGFTSGILHLLGYPEPKSTVTPRNVRVANETARTRSSVAH